MGERVRARKETISEKSFSFVEKLQFFQRIASGLNGCYLWLGSVDEEGYGIITHRDRTLHAHAVAFALARGEAPNDGTVRHKCSNKLCVIPAHLFGGKGRLRKIKHEDAPEYINLSLPLSAENVIQHVANAYGYAPEDMKRRGRSDRRLSSARFVVMSLLHEHGFSYKTIGVLLGGRDHSSILYGCRRVAEDNRLRTIRLAIKTKMTTPTP